MKRICYLLLAVIMLAGCGKDEEEFFIESSSIAFARKQFWQISFDKARFINIDLNNELRIYKSNNAVTEKGIYKIQYSSLDTIWTSPLDVITYEDDLGYGETQIKTATPSAAFFPDSYNIYLYYQLPAMAIFYFYDEKGKILSKKEIKNTEEIPIGWYLPTSPWDKNKLMIGIRNDNVSDYDNYYLTIDKNGVLDEEHYRFVDENGKDTSLSLGDWLVASGNSYWSIPKDYNDTYLIHYIVKDGSIFYVKEVLNIDTYIKGLYPNEEHRPRYSVSSREVGKEYLTVKIDVTLYSGKKETIELKFDNKTGEIIK